MCVQLSDSWRTSAAAFVGSVVLLGAAACAASTSTQPDVHPNPATDQQVQLERLNALMWRIDEALRPAEGNKLAELEALRGLEAEYAGKGPEAQQALGVRSMELAAQLGNYAEALRYADLGQSSKDSNPAGVEPLEDYRPQDALTALAHVADTTRVIMVNEAHHVPQHRAFTLQLLRVLQEKGFTHFAAEALSDSDTLLARRGYPTERTGTYTAEPVYGDLIRTALRLGYRVVPYEATHAADRERGQAENLVDQTLNADPQAKILVHAGYSHINEAGLLAGERPMALQFREITGIDPVTVDQTVMSEHSTPEREHPLYRDVVGKGLVTEPTVFRDVEGEFWALEKELRDITVFHPRSRYENGRPTWLRLGGTREVYALPADVCGTATQCLVSARVVGETPDAIPIDQVEVRAGEQIPALLLPEGTFVVKAQDRKGEVVNISSLTFPVGSGPDTIEAIDLYGLRTVPEATVRTAVGLAAGDPAPESLEPIRARLPGIPGVAAVDASIVCCGELGGSLLYVGIQERGRPPIAFHTAPTGDARRP